MTDGKLRRAMRLLIVCSLRISRSTSSRLQSGRGSGEQTPTFETGPVERRTCCGAGCCSHLPAAPPPHLNHELLPVSIAMPPSGTQRRFCKGRAMRGDRCG